MRLRFVLSSRQGRRSSHQVVYEELPFSSKIYYYRPRRNSPMTSFHDAFAAFPWEGLGVYSPLPKVAFTWRQWGEFTGTYEGNQGEGQKVELFGLATATVNDNLQLCDVELFLQPSRVSSTCSGAPRRRSSTPTGRLVDVPSTLCREPLALPLTVPSRWMAHIGFRKHELTNQINSKEARLKPRSTPFPRATPLHSHDKPDASIFYLQCTSRTDGAFKQEVQALLRSSWRA